MNRKDRQVLRAFAAREMERRGALEVVNIPEVLDSRTPMTLQSFRMEWKWPTKFGMVRVGLRGPFVGERASRPWMPCQLLDWDAPMGVFNWLGWRHWKQNLLLTGELEKDEVLIREHLDQFNQDQGEGFLYPLLTMEKTYEVEETT